MTQRRATNRRRARARRPGPSSGNSSPGPARTASDESTKWYRVRKGWAIFGGVAVVVGLSGYTFRDLIENDRDNGVDPTAVGPSSPLLDGEITAEYYVDGPLYATEPLDPSESGYLCYSPSAFSERADATDCSPTLDAPRPDTWDPDGMPTELPTIGPCFVTDETSVVCPQSYLDDDFAYVRHPVWFGISLASPAQRVPVDARPWRIKLEDGSICVAQRPQSVAPPATYPGAPMTPPATARLSGVYDCDESAAHSLFATAWWERRDDGSLSIDWFGVLPAGESEREQVRSVSRSAEGIWTGLHAEQGSLSLQPVLIIEAWF